MTTSLVTRILRIPFVDLVGEILDLTIRLKRRFQRTRDPGRLQIFQKMLERQNMALWMGKMELEKSHVSPAENSFLNSQGVEYSSRKGAEEEKPKKLCAFGLCARL